MSSIPAFIPQFGPDGEERNFRAIWAVTGRQLHEATLKSDSRSLQAEYAKLYGEFRNRGGRPDDIVGEVLGIKKPTP